jgi:ribonuclease HI
VNEYAKQAARNDRNNLRNSPLKIIYNMATLYMYPDGCYLPSTHSASGSGLAICRSDTHQWTFTAYSLDHTANAEIAEHEGAIFALKYAMSIATTQEISSVVVHTDNSATLRLLQRIHGESYGFKSDQRREALADAILEHMDALYDLGISSEGIRVPARSGDKGNEYADTLAR